MAGKKNRGKDTDGLTLRLERGVIQYYEKVAHRANRLRLLRGESGLITKQDVMRHRLASLPGLKEYLASSEGVATD